MPSHCLIMLITHSRKGFNNHSSQLRSPALISPIYSSTAAAYSCTNTLRSTLRKRNTNQHFSSTLPPLIQPLALLFSPFPGSHRCLCFRESSVPPSSYYYC